MFCHILSRKMLLTCVELWILLWLLGICCIVNVLSHMEQANGFSPVWILSWILGCCRILNGLPHIEQAKGFLLVYHHTFLCLVFMSQHTHNIQPIQTGKSRSNSKPKMQHPLLQRLTQYKYAFFISVVRNIYSANG